jgi:DNA polymerase (family 10)
MPVHNTDIARIFNQIADLLEIDNASPFRVRAYRNAARTVKDQPQSITTMLAQGKELSELPNIGDDLAAKIAEIVETGTLQRLDELEQDIPGALANLLQISGLGPKRVATLHRGLGIDTLDDLAEAAHNHSILELKGYEENYR